MESFSRTASMRPSRRPLTRAPQDDEIRGSHRVRHGEERPQGRVSNHARADNNNSGGNTMSSNKSATRRLSLLTGSSLIVAGAAMAALAGAPATAWAANECGDPSANGGSNDTFTCEGTFPSIIYPDTDGNLRLRLRGPVTVTGGLSVTATGTNTVTIDRLNGGDPGDPSITNNAGAGIDVDRTTGGTVSIDLRDNDNGDGPISVSGTTAGIRVRNAGTASTTLTIGRTTQDGGLATVTASSGAAYDFATTGTGAITINTGAVVTGATAAIRVVSGNNVTINQAAGTLAGSIGGVLNGRFLLDNTGNTTFNNDGEWRFGGTSTLRDTSVLTGTATFNNDRITVTSDGASTIDFGQATGILSNSGYLGVGGEAGASTLTLQGLDTWDNTGQVIFGITEGFVSDGETNDRIVVSNDTAATFTGDVASELFMDVNFTASQDSCAAAVTADCLDLRGHNTAGVTGVVVNPVSVGVSAERIVLVDVAGDGIDEGVFTISDQSANFRPFGTGMVDTGLFLYELTHDEDAQQHVLMVSGVDEEGVQLNLAGRAAFTAWDTATGAWFGRQADMRNSLGNGTGSHGWWVRGVNSSVNQTLISQLEFGGTSVDSITSHVQDSSAIVAGVDLVGAIDGSSAWVFGLTAGKADSEFKFKENSNNFEFDGYMMGAYASYLTKDLFIDATVNALRMDTTYVLPSIGLELEGDATSLGYRIEGGLRWDWGEGVLFEPMATLSYVTTDLGSVAIAPGVSVDYDSVSDFRAALGARLSGDVPFNNFTVRLAGLGRIWQAVNGDTESAIATPFGDFGFTDETDDTTGEVGLSVGIFDAGGRFTVQADSGVMFRDDYQNVKLSVGARYQW